MQQFSRRVLLRHITSSNILVVSTDAESALVAAQNRHNETPQKDTTTTTRKQSVGAEFLLHAAEEGHSVHVLPNNHTLDQWWKSFGKGTRTQERPEWILLAVFDQPKWMEDVVWENSTQFLKEVTATYIVLTVHSLKQKDGTYKFGGLTAVERLLKRRYKPQILLMSHQQQLKVGGGKHRTQQYDSNSLFHSVGDIKEFLQWGADTATQRHDSRVEEVFTAYLFATQGLDLAIPSTDTYLITKSSQIDPMEKMEKQDLLSLKRCSNDQSLDLQFEGVSISTLFSLSTFL